MQRTPLRARRLDRRGFLGAAAGVAVVGAAASPIAWAKKMEGPSCDEVAARIPKARRGAIHLHAARAGLEHEGGLRGHDRVLQGAQHQRLGVRGRLPDGRGHQPQQRHHALPGRASSLAGLSGWEAFGSYANTYGFRLVGTHDGPSPTSAANLGSAITKMNAWSCNQLGAGGGYPSGAINLPGAGTAITNPSAISAWQASAATMNSWGQAYQTGHGAGVLGSTAVRPGRLPGDGAHRRAGPAPATTAISTPSRGSGSRTRARSTTATTSPS